MLVVVVMDAVAVVDEKKDVVNNEAQETGQTLYAEKLFEAVRVVLARKGIKAEKKYQQASVAVFFTLDKLDYLSFENIVSLSSRVFDLSYGESTQKKMKSFINSLEAEGVLETAVVNSVKRYRITLDVYADILAKYQEFVEQAEDEAEANVHELLQKLVEDNDAYRVVDDKKFFVLVFDLSYIHARYEKLYEHLQADFDNLRDELIQLVAEKFERDVSLVRVYFVNAVKQKRLHDVSSLDGGTFVTVTANISFVKNVESFIRKAVYVCKDCGEEHVLLQYPYSKHEKPLRCSACGSRNLFLDIMKSKTVDIVKMLIEDSYEVLNIDEEKKEFEAYMLYPPSQLDALVGQTVKLTVLVRNTALLSLRKDSTAKLYIEVVGIESDEKNDTVSSQMIKLVEAEREKFDNTHAWFEHVIKTVAPSLAVSADSEGYLHDAYIAYLSMLLSAVSDKRKLDDTTISAVNVLIAGDRGTGKSTFARMLEKFKSAVYISATNTSRGGLVGIVEQRENFGWIYRRGAVLDAKNSTLIIDEADKLTDDDYAVLLDVMSVGRFIFNKADVKLSTDVVESVIFLMNPKNGRFSNIVDAFAQISLKRAELFDRFSLIVFLRDDASKSERELIRKSKIEYLRKLSKSEDNKNEQLAYAILHVAKNKRVRFSDEAFDELEKQVARIDKLFKLSDVRFDYSSRLIVHLHNIAIAVAKLDLSDEVTAKHVKLASELFIEAVKSWGVDFSELEKKLFVDEKKNDAFVYVKAVAKKFREKGMEVVDYDTVVDELSKFVIDKKRAEEIIRDARDAGLLEIVEEEFADENSKKEVLFNVD